MQVLSPAEFSWKVLSATNSPQVTAFDPQKAFRSPLLSQVNKAPLFPTPKVAVSVPPQNIPFPPQLPSDNSRFEQLGNQVKFLEAEVRRMTEELKVRSGTISKARAVQEKLTLEVDDLKEEVGRLRSLIRARERHIEELEKQLSLSQSQLLTMKKRYRAAVDAAMTTTPGTIKHVAAEQQSIGIQAGDIQGLEDRMSKLVLALRDEKLRNRRIKNMLSLQDEYGDSSVPPLPPVDNRFFHKRTHRGFVSQGTSTPAAITKIKPRLTVESTGIMALMGGNKVGQKSSSFRGQVPKNEEQFLEIHINASERLLPPVLSLDSPTAGGAFTNSEISPINYLKDSFTVYDDPADHSHHFGGGSVDWQRQHKKHHGGKKNSSVSTAASQMRPPKMEVPRLNLPSTLEHDDYSQAMSSGRSNASEAAIKRAVAAAIEKRKNLAVSSSMSSAASDTTGYYTNK